MLSQQTKKFGIYHWDTFDNGIILIDQANTLKEAREIVENKYKGRIEPHGADVVEIVNMDGERVGRYNVI